MTGWDLEYIRNLPFYQVLQLIAFSLNWEGNEIKWKRGDKHNRKRLDNILNNNG